MASGIYDRFFANLMNKIVDLEADTIKVALLDNSHSFTQTNNVWSDVSANEISGTGYTAGGATLASKAVSQGTGASWVAADVTWSSSTISTYHAVIYDVTATSNLICSIDFGGEQTTTAADFTIAWDADGIIELA